MTTIFVLTCRYRQSLAGLLASVFVTCQYVHVVILDCITLQSAEYQYMLLHMWQSRVEIEGYSVSYFDHIAVLEALNR